LYPATVAVVLAFQLRSTLCCIVPVPLSEALAGELVALLATEMEPVTFPAAWGWNKTATALLVPAATVNGVCTLELKPAPETVIPDTLTFTELGFESVRFCEELLPTTSFPNDTVEGETLSVATVGETPVP